MTPPIAIGMTPHFTIRVWGSPGRHYDQLSDLLSEPRKRVPIAEIEVDTTETDRYGLTIVPHRGLELIPQKMLTWRVAQFGREDE
jgi:hypothetical protein